MALANQLQEALVPNSTPHRTRVERRTLVHGSQSRAGERER